jgi:hypothetical protein
MCRIDQPDKQVLATITSRFTQQLFAVLAIGDPDACAELYRKVKELPATFTRGVIQQDLQVSINGPLSDSQPLILIAADYIARKHLLLKLLRIPEMMDSRPVASRLAAVQKEIETCEILQNARILGLVECDVVYVTVEHSDQIGVSPGVWAAIKMPRYVSALSQCPQAPESFIRAGFHRILKALQAMHNLKLVHMDVKSDNVLVSALMDWDLCDFGSARGVNEQIWTFTKLFQPYDIPSKATVIPEMDLISLCVMIAVELKKDNWHERLCEKGDESSVSLERVRSALSAIESAEFKEEVLALFDSCLENVQKHLKKFVDQVKL